MWTVKRGADTQTPGWVSNIVVEEYLSQAESLKVDECTLNLSFGMNKTKDMKCINTQFLNGKNPQVFPQPTTVR